MQTKDGLQKAGQIGILLLLGLVSWRAGQDILSTVQISPSVFTDNFSKRALVWVFFMIGNVGLLILITGAAWRRGPFMPGSGFMNVVDAARSIPRWMHILVVGFVLILPSLIIYFIPKEDVIGHGALRFWILIFFSALAGVFLTRERGRLLNLLPFLCGLLAVTVVSNMAYELTMITNYPFSMGWSEGNRFYDYSLIFGTHLYQSSYPVDLAYYSPGRYGLWGLPFLIDGLPISIHRLWDAILWALAPLLFGWLLLPEANWKWRLGLAMWTAIFIYQGPVYPTLIISAILVAIAFHSKPIGKWLGMIGGSFFAGLSRWTWLAVVGAWGAILEQLNHPRRELPLVRRYLPALITFIAGVLPGVIANLPRLATPKETTITLSQPLLWYRLFPNSTFPPGILLALLLAAGPLVVFLWWLPASRRWRLDWSQKLMILGACMGFLVSGLAISTKIGGGSNLHNLDMFFFTLLFLLGAALKEQLHSHQIPFQDWPGWVRVWVVIGMLIPAWMIFSNGGPLVLPSMDLAQEYLEDIQMKVDTYRVQGEILFIDQRQLLTFQLVKNVDLVPDYEKKYMMDQAMADNVAYFRQFHQDLADHRFALIVTEPLFLVTRGEDYSFGEENDAFVKWVSRPVLCNYQILDTLDEVRVQYLVPRQEAPPAALGCPGAGIGLGKRYSP